MEFRIPQSWFNPYLPSAYITGWRYYYISNGLYDSNTVQKTVIQDVSALLYGVLIKLFSTNPLVVVGARCPI